DITGIEGVDTRALTRILRSQGTMNGMITTDREYRLEEVLPKLKAYTTGKVVEKVTCREKYTVKPSVALGHNGPLSGAARFDGEAYKKG
ncbi:carbamoyl phosphate synthase small subunit, partial [Klebsiella oxytoca]